MKNIESRIHLGRKETEINETSPVVDLFSTLEEVKTAKKRLYNPRHRTPEAQKVWNNLPDFLEEFNRIDRFFEQSNFETEFNTKVEGLIVRVPELAIQI
ncbi:hypothetical protein KKB43_00620, partial [Patescibacteria group bacterium]|nr:hypothetical protein [Patescibacteria group bacterium]